LNYFDARKIRRIKQENLISIRDSKNGGKIIYRGRGKVTVFIDLLTEQYGIIKN